MIQKNESKSIVFKMADIFFLGFNGLMSTAYKGILPSKMFQEQEQSLKLCQQHNCRP